MNSFNGFKGRVDADAPLADLTWFKLGGPARWLVSPGSRQELRDALRRCADHDLIVKVLGGGANVLIRDDGVDGVVVRLDDPVFSDIRFDGPCVDAGGGADLMKLTHACARRGLSGLEPLAGIPGSVGGALRQNAGGRDAEFGSFVEHVVVIDKTGCVEQLTRDELHFGYRSSSIGDRIVLAARLRLTLADPEITLPTYRRYWSEKRRSQPMSERSAGCVFKNPPGRSAGALIDAAGLKGFAVGGASVSNRHANFIVTNPGATSADVLAVIDHVRNVVGRESGVDLELEIEVW